MNTSDGLGARLHSTSPSPCPLSHRLCRSMEQRYLVLTYTAPGLRALQAVRGHLEAKQARLRADIVRAQQEIKVC